VARVIDDRGRLLGRVNLVDAAIVLFALLLVPIAYLTLLLFRPAKPAITSVDRAQITYIEERAAAGTTVEGKLKVHGSGLRPTLRARIGDRDAVGFLFETPTSADVLFGDIPPGTYDLVLYDGVQEVARSPRAVTVTAKPAPGGTRVLAIGAFVELDEQTAAALKVGGPAGEGRQIIALGPVERDFRRVSFDGGVIEVPLEQRVLRRAAVLIPCTLGPMQECVVDGGSIGLRDRTLVVAASTGPARLLIEEIVPAAAPTPATLRVRFAAYRDAIDRVRAGDRDLPHLALDGRGAAIESLARQGDQAGEVTFAAPRSGGDNFARGVVSSLSDRLGVTDATLKAGLDKTSLGWRYRGQAVKIGGSLTFTTDTYTIRGTVLDVQTDGAATPK